MDAQIANHDALVKAPPPPGLARVRSILVPVITFIFAAAIMAITFVDGQRRGMDHVAAFGPESEQAAIAVALSDIVYKLNAGYLGYATVHDKLVSIWDEGAKDQHDPILIENSKNRDLINRAITAAASLGPQQPGYVGDRSLITTVYDDVGFVDYVKLSFRLFGFRIESLYRTFFVLLAVSTLGFLWTFRRNVPAQAVLVFTLFAFLIEIHTAIFTIDMPTFAGMRHGSTLVLIPMWYFGFLLLDPAPFPIGFARSGRVAVPVLRQGWQGCGTVIISLVQLAILILAIKIRGSAAWTVLFVISVAIVIGLVRWRHAPAPRRSFRSLLGEVVRWPVILLIGGLFAHGQYMNMILHPVYFTDDVMPHHGLWQSAYLGLQYAPEMLPERNGQLMRSLGPTDPVAFFAASDYLAQTHFLRPSPDLLSVPTGYISPWTGTLKFRLQDEIMRRVFLQAILRHPFKAVELYALLKPYAIYVDIKEIFHRTSNFTWLWLIILGGLVGAGALTWLGDRQPEETAKITLFIAAAVPFAALPNMWAYPAFHTVADLFLVTLILAQACISMLVAVGTQVGRNYRAAWPQGGNP
jgi:hypothetical protein